jgi:hypothetical protein
LDRWLSPPQQTRVLCCCLDFQKNELTFPVSKLSKTVNLTSWQIPWHNPARAKAGHDLKVSIEKIYLVDDEAREDWRSLNKLTTDLVTD